MRVNISTVSAPHDRARTVYPWIYKRVTVYEAVERELEFRPSIIRTQYLTILLLILLLYDNP